MQEAGVILAESPTYFSGRWWSTALQLVLVSVVGGGGGRGLKGWGVGSFIQEPPASHSTLSSEPGLSCKEGTVRARHPLGLSQGLGFAVQPCVSLQRSPWSCSCPTTDRNHSHPLGYGGQLRLRIPKLPVGRRGGGPEMKTSAQTERGSSAWPRVSTVVSHT